MLNQIRAKYPPQVSITILDPGYSTAQRNGGFETNSFCGALPNILSLMANSHYVAYLDDYGWRAADHLASMMQAISWKHWAVADRWMVRQETLWPIRRDKWDSVSPGSGINNERYGGLVAPSGLTLHKRAFGNVLPQWDHALIEDGGGNDRRILAALNCSFMWAASGRYKVYYVLNARALRDAHHACECAQRVLNWVYDTALIDAFRRHASDARECYERVNLMMGAELAQGALAVNSNRADALH